MGRAVNISKGDIVLSLAGRDKGKLFFVLDVEGEYASLADGKIRRTERPKRKKLKHLKPVASPQCHAAEKLRKGTGVLDSELRRELAVFGQAYFTGEDEKSWQKTM